MIRVTLPPRNPAPFRIASSDAARWPGVSVDQTRHTPLASTISATPGRRRTTTRLERSNSSAPRGSESAPNADTADAGASPADTPASINAAPLAVVANIANDAPPARLAASATTASRADSATWHRLRPSGGAIQHHRRSVRRPTMPLSSPERFRPMPMSVPEKFWDATQARALNKEFTRVRTNPRAGPNLGNSPGVDRDPPARDPGRRAPGAVSWPIRCSLGRTARRDQLPNYSIHLPNRFGRHESHFVP